MAIHDLVGKKLPNISYHPSDILAQVIVDAWIDPVFKTRLLGGDAKAILADRGLYLANPVVISQHTFNKDYQMKENNEVVFVVPDKTLIGTYPPGAGGNLLETARALMAAVANGI